MTDKTRSANATTGTPRMIAVSSGKGGVGKSTVTVNLAVAMARAGLRVGIVDADIYGPSIPGMLGIPGNVPPAMGPDQRVTPSEAHGVKVISMGMLTDHDQPSILRGPMVTKYLRLFVGQVAWGEIDVLLLDLPPGTGDIQLTLAQSFPLSGAIVVSTPQDVSLKIARRGLRMMEQVQVPIIGVIENMSGFTCPSCGEVSHIFHQGGGERIAADLAVPFLGKVPLDPAIVDSGDDGVPLVISHPDSPAAQAYSQIATELADIHAGGRGIALPFDWDVATGKGTPAPTPATGGAQDLPCAIDHNVTGLDVLWPNGDRRVLPTRDLRIACPCAACRDEMTGARLLDPETIPLNVTPIRIWSVGNYAIGISFSDGHSSGIYSYKALRQMQKAAFEDV